MYNTIINKVNFSLIHFITNIEINTKKLCEKLIMPLNNIEVDPKLLFIYMYAYIYICIAS